MQKMRRWFPVSLRDFLVTVAILVCAVVLCIMLRMADDRGEFASLIFVLAVLLISRLTTGYLFGMIAAILGVVGVNYIFTYPYFAFDFTIAGYPLTFFVMLWVSMLTSTMTSQVKRQEKLRMENEREKMRADLLRAVSHDIRTPLTSIIGATSTVLDNADALPQSEQKALLEDARDEAQWLIRVVENLLFITRIGNQQAGIVKEQEAAEEIFSEVARKFRKRFPEIKLSVEAPEELMLVPMDPILIEQVLANLLENAVLHGGTTTRIELSVRAAGSLARFSVKDDGKGIAPEALSTLFDGALKHGGEQTIDGKRNMGLGLSVCTAVVRVHGGRMEARNLVGKGAEIAFYLPLN